MVSVKKTTNLYNEISKWYLYYGLEVFYAFQNLLVKQSSLLTCDPEKLEREGFKDISLDIQDREKIKVSAET